MRAGNTAGRSSILARSIVAIIGTAGALCACLNLAAHLLYAACISLWVYIPSVAALAMIPIALIDRRWIARAIGWCLAGLVVTSYIAENWRWTADVWNSDRLWLVIEILQTGLFLICLFAMHRRDVPPVESV